MTQPYSPSALVSWILHLLASIRFFVLLRSSRNQTSASHFEVRPPISFSLVISVHCGVNHLNFSLQCYNFSFDQSDLFSKFSIFSVFTYESSNHPWNLVVTCDCHPNRLVSHQIHITFTLFSNENFHIHCV